MLNSLVKVISGIGSFYRKLGMLLTLVVTGCITIFWQVHLNENYELETINKKNQLVSERHNLERIKTEIKKINKNYDTVYKPLIEIGFIGGKHRLDLVEIIDKFKQNYFFINLEYKFEKDHLISLEKNQHLRFGSGPIYEDPISASVPPPALDLPGMNINTVILDAEEGRMLSTTPIIFSFDLFDLRDLLGFIKTLRAKAPGQLMLKEWWINGRDDVDELLQDALTQLRTGETKLKPPLSVRIKLDWNIVLDSGFTKSSQTETNRVGT